MSVSCSQAHCSPRSCTGSLIFLCCPAVHRPAQLCTHLPCALSSMALPAPLPCSEALTHPVLLSPGFYELSDGGSCSLSTSCASVCSDHMPPSLGSLLPAIQISKDRPAVGDWRPRSADETTVPVWRPQPTEVSGLPGSIEDAVRLPRGTFRPRPVSTGKKLPGDER